MDKYLQAYFVDASLSKMALIKVPMLVLDGLPEVPYTVKVEDKLGILISKSPLTYKWIEDPLVAEIITEK